MREILFKAKTEGGRWIYGDLIHYESGEIAIVEDPFSKYGREATEIAGRTKVIPETVCQYTGLTDKNGNKIWENDVVANKNYRHPVQISWSTEFGGWVAIQIKIRTSELIGEVYQKDCEVIGNIFDNPELMKEGQ